MTAVQSLRSKALLSQIEGDRCAVSLLFVSQHPHLPLLFQFTVSIGTTASGQGKRACSSAPHTPLLTVSKKSPGCPGCLGSVLTPTQHYSELPAGSFPRSPCPSSQPLPPLSLLGGRVLWQSPPSTWRASAL